MYVQDVLGNDVECVSMETLKPKRTNPKEGNKPIEREAKAKVARYNLSLPAPLMEGLQRIADEECTTVLEIIRKFIKLGLIAVQAQRNGGRLILEQGGEKTAITMI